MTNDDHQHTTGIEFISTMERQSNHQHDVLSAVMSKSIADSNGKIPLIQDHSKILRRIDGVVIGRLTEVEVSRGVWIDYPGNISNAPLLAVSTVAVSKEDVGKEVALAFE